MFEELHKKSVRKDQEPAPKFGDEIILGSLPVRPGGKWSELPSVLWPVLDLNQPWNPKERPPRHRVGAKLNPAEGIDDTFAEDQPLLKRHDDASIIDKAPMEIKDEFVNGKDKKSGQQPKPFLDDSAIPKLFFYDKRSDEVL
ncbi:MAG: hypothetical protein C5B53_00510 [Candidatus Melainabacteria bacterium]|nr:MAG: hypothetical protein C5B53_00510 [Candidatus Melainabacteria bacterium]